MKIIIIFFIRIYKRFISPILPDSCRFYPSCSQYALNAVKKYGALKGGMLTVYRIIRCNPFNKGGYDPVK
ncbi:MAG: membrane protein insertion efficiency factor YidD [Actinobacteria bacterium]|nr:membrane protein insertion efficiency factor YidD [Actinomycetota bacterium]